MNSFRAYNPTKVIEGIYVLLRDDGFVSGETSAGSELSVVAKLPRNKPRTLQLVSELKAVWDYCLSTDKMGKDQATDVG